MALKPVISHVLSAADRPLGERVRMLVAVLSDGDLGRFRCRPRRQPTQQTLRVGRASKDRNRERDSDRRDRLSR